MGLVIRNCLQKSGSQRGAQHALFCNQWIGESQRPRFIHSDRGLIARSEERVRHRLAQSETAHHLTSETSPNLDVGESAVNRRRRNDLAKILVPDVPGEFFNEINLRHAIWSPRRHRDAHRFLAIVHTKSKWREHPPDSCSIQFLTEHTVHLAKSKVQLRRRRGKMWCSCIAHSLVYDEIRAGQPQQLGKPCDCSLSAVGVHSPLEPKGCLGAQSKS